MESVRLGPHMEKKEWWWDDNARKVFLHLLFVCDEDGSAEISLHSLAVETRLSIKNVRTAVATLEKFNEVARKVAKKTARITFIDIESYKDRRQDKRQDKRQDNPQPKTTPKKPENPSPRTDLDRRAHEFGKTLIPFLDTYGREMVREFYDYWTEPNKSRTKMRFELERTWDAARRLRTWSDRHGVRGKNGGRPDAAEQAARDIQEIHDYFRNNYGGGKDPFDTPEDQ